jgi:nucleoside-diphosphate-sugar epimerase
MRVLLLGGNGYVGSALNQGLHGFDIHSVDLCLFGANLAYSLQTDVSTLCKKHLQDYDVVIILTAHSSVSLCVTDPVGAIRNNVWNPMRIAHMLSPKQKFIYASSTGVYGQTTQACTESDVTYQHHNWYDITKQTLDVGMEKLISEGGQIVGLRFGTVCGVAPNMRKDLFLNSMVHHACTQNQLWFNNANSRRSVLATSDLVQAFQTLLDSDFVPGIYNLKSFDTHMAEAAHTVANQLSVPITKKPDDTNSYDFVVDHTSFCNTYAWQPQETLASLINALNQSGNYHTWFDRAKWPQGIGYEF